LLNANPICISVNTGMKFRTTLNPLHFHVNIAIYKIVSNKSYSKMAKGRGDEVAERLIKIVIYKKPTRERLLYNSIDYTITKENKTELRKFFFCESRV